MTKKETLKKIASITSDADILAYVNKELDLIERKASEASAKRSSKIGDKMSQVVEAMAGLEVKENQAHTIAQAMGLNTQSITRALTLLVEEGSVKREMKKNVAYFSLVE